MPPINREATISDHVEKYIPAGFAVIAVALLIIGMGHFASSDKIVNMGLTGMGEVSSAFTLMALFAVISKGDFNDKMKMVAAIALALIFTEVATAFTFSSVTTFGLLAGGTLSLTYAVHKWAKEQQLPKQNYSLIPLYFACTLIMASMSFTFWNSGWGMIPTTMAIGMGSAALIFASQDKSGNSSLSLGFCTCLALGLLAGELTYYGSRYFDFSSSAVKWLGGTSGAFFFFSALSQIAHKKEREVYERS